MNVDAAQRLPGQPPLTASEAVVVRLRLIGQMEAWTVTSENVLPPGRKTRALLAIVALSGPRPALRGRLAELLWSRRPEEQARASLRQEIHRLLEALLPAGTDVLTITRDHLALRPGVVWVDVDELTRATTAHPGSLSLLDGDLLEDLDGVDPAFDAWLAAERERVRDRARNLAEALLREQLEPERAIPAAQQLLSIDRSHEGAWRALMRAHAARGERGLAIQAYDRCRSVLADMLDAAPSAETQRLLAEIRGPASLKPGQRPALPTAGGGPAPVPAAAEPDADSAQPLEFHTESRGATRGGARVGVMPMQTVGLTAEDAHLGPGLAEEITTALARFRWMFVVSSNSLDRFAMESRDEAAIRRTFGIDFLLDGTIQRAQSKLRINVRLLDLRSSNQVVWARRFDRQAQDILSLQDEIAAEVVGQIDPEILLIESKRATTKPPSDPTAYDLMLRALPLINRLEKSMFLQAEDLLARAIAIEPDYAAAHAWYAYWYAFLIGQGWAEDPQHASERANELAERAVGLDPFDSHALTISGHVSAFVHHRLQTALTLHERALSLNPNLAMAWAFSGLAYGYLGDLDEAERRMQRYKRLSPIDPHAFLFDIGICFTHLLKRDYESAVAVGRHISQLNPSFSNGFKPYLAALGHLGHMQEATVVRRRLLAIEPTYTVARFLKSTPFTRAQDRDHYAEGLRRAGLPEGD